jgi:hypothetical protein
MTRAELMRHALSQALRRVHIGPKKLKLDEETRWQIAGEAVEAVGERLNAERATKALAALSLSTLASWTCPASNHGQPDKATPSPEAPSLVRKCETAT